MVCNYIWYKKDVSLAYFDRYETEDSFHMQFL